MTDTPVTLRCPACGHEWLAAIVTPWDGPVQPATIAQRCYCRACQHAPPMTVMDEGRLF